MPPAPAPAGPVTGIALELSTSDGCTYPAYLATPLTPTGPPIVLLPDAGGLHPFYMELARRFAGLGHPALAIDYFGRTALSDDRDDDFEHEPHLEQLHRSTMLLDVRAGVAHLTKVTGTAPFVLGFCIGGATALLAGTTDMDVAGVVAFYPWTGGFGSEPALEPDFVAGMRRPVLGLFGEADEVVPPDLARSFDTHLDTAGIPHEMVFYADAPHGFFERHYLNRMNRPDIVDDVWRRLATFFTAK